MNLILSFMIRGVPSDSNKYKRECNSGIECGVRNERAMSTAMERLSTGKRINSAADDAAGQAIALEMSSQVKGLEQAARNANDAISMVQTVRGCGKEILNILTE